MFSVIHKKFDKYVFVTVYIWPALGIVRCYRKVIIFIAINPLVSKSNYSVTSNTTKLVHWPLMGGLLQFWYSEEGPGRAAASHSPLLAVPNVTAHPSTVSVPITVLLYDGPLLCGFNVAIKGLMTVVSRCNLQVKQYDAP